MTNIDSLIQIAKVTQDEDGDYVAETEYQGENYTGMGVTRSEALQHLREFLVMAEEEHAAGPLA